MASSHDDVEGPALVVLLPPLGMPLELFGPVAAAQEEAAYLQEEARGVGRPGGAGRAGAAGRIVDVTVVCDRGAGGAANSECVELLSSGPAVALRIPCLSTLPFLVLHMCDVGRHVSVEVACRDTGGVLRRVTATTRGSSVRATAGAVTVPLELGAGGWQLVRIDLARTLALAFGTDYARAERVTVAASCRVARIYFERAVCENADLPAWLCV